jgi:hypothetical protein
MNTCEGCTYHLPSNTYDMACYRPKRMASGRVLTPYENVGFAVEYETAKNSMYDGRADSDDCGVERRNWRAA